MVYARISPPVTWSFTLALRFKTQGLRGNAEWQAGALVPGLDKGHSKAEWQHFVKVDPIWCHTTRRRLGGVPGIRACSASH